ncbi:MerR family transcriptional regulator [Lacisediminihabitans sp. G11-30]|uniref:MerR family transcriptional regulator n=2 Tax=Lacisediminihabitans changchengi TaxID=2787634 RepID=A0A934SH25_9MICO|nr:MerR family transcriptional regulator [Lacisediminihabitans changchengi]MBK4346537.1 MerR family transcriptional regulator [Lacisediminihabitans changchengi]
MTGSAPDTMHIGELADKSNLSQRTIRHYEEVGLLKPAGRSEGGFRLYTHDDLMRLLVIRRMKPLGFSLDEMAEVLRIIDTVGSSTASANDESVAADLDSFIDQAIERRATLQEHLALADEFVELLRQQRLLR